MLKTIFSEKFLVKRFVKERNCEKKNSYLFFFGLKFFFFFLSWLSLLSLHALWRSKCQMNRSRQGRPRWYQTLHRLLAPLFCPKTIQATRDTSHMNTWSCEHMNLWTFSQNFRSLVLTVWERQCLEDWEENDYWLTDEEINYKRACTASATPGLLKICGIKNSENNITATF